MKKRQALAAKNAPRNLPITSLIIWWLLFDRLNVSQLVWGIFGTILIILFIGCAVDYFTAEEIEIGDKS